MVTTTPRTRNRTLEPDGSSPSRARRWPWLLLVAVAAVLPYLPSLAGELVWDDRLLIAEELRFHSPRFLVEVFTTGFFADIEEIYRYGYYRPLTTLSYYLTWLAVGAEPLAYHLGNLVLHALVSLLVLVTGRELAPTRPALGVVAGLLFAVHPVHAENVAWISGRTDLLAALFLLAAILALLRARPWVISHATASTLSSRLVLSVACFALAPFAKEAVVFWPLVVAVVAALAPPAQRRWWWTAAAASAVALVPAALLRVAAAGTGGPSQQWTSAELPAVVLTFPVTVARYLRAVILPSGAEPYIQNPLVGTLLDPRVAVGAVVLASAVVAAWRWRRTRPELAATLAFLLLSLGPIANLVRIAGPTDMGAPMAQRFLYIPSAALCLLVAAGVAELLARAPTAAARRVVAAAVALAVAVLAGSAAAAARPWRSEEQLFELMAAQVPDAPLPLLLLGTVHCRQRDWQPCLDQLTAANALLPTRPTKLTIAVKSNLAGALAATGRIGAARALLEELRATAVPTSNVEYNLGMTWVAEGQGAAALPCFDRALAINPWHPTALVARARLRADSGDLDGAAADLGAHASRYDETSQSLLALAVVRGRQGRDDEAAAALRRAAAGDDREALAMLAGWAASTGHWDESLTASDRLATLDPSSWPAARAGAVALARLGRRDQALARLADYRRRAGSDPRVDALAASLLGDAGGARAGRRRGAAGAPPS